MKITAAAGDIAAALQLGTALRAPKGNPSAHLRAAEDGLAVRCADVLAVASVSARCEAVVAAPGELAVASDRLLGIVSSFRLRDKVTIGIDEPGAKIICGNSRYRLPAIPIDSLPAALAIDRETARIEIGATDCATLFEPIAATGREETRFYLNGIFLHVVGDCLVSVATDGHCLIKVEIPASMFPADFNCIMPTAAVTGLRKVLARTRPDRIVIRRSQRLIEFSTSDFVFASRLIEATYPDYRRVIPEGLAPTATVDRCELLAALARLSAAATSEAAPVAALRWDEASGRLEVFLARQPNDGIDAITAKSIDSAQIAAPIGQLTDMVEQFACEKISLQTASAQPLLLRDGSSGKLGLIARATWNSPPMEIAFCGTSDPRAAVCPRGSCGTK